MNKNDIIEIPIAKYILVTICGKVSEKIYLKVKYIIWPPSNKGMGNKLNIPTKRDIIMKIRIIPFNLSNINLSAILTIPIGPANSLVIVLLLIDWIKYLYVAR